MSPYNDDIIIIPYAGTRIVNLSLINSKNVAEK